ncbi:iron ABC transporter ATP-binding protein [Chitinimonas prasina]|uniref:Iron ABC transporter ATP-binding protein n=1 Tax=Chitinimonas prasina TaxID=1434937 RepID=A0ABQ5YBQ0_9NEIS|nr:ABC transporter ATP-binding protein [Chitinimonas prasina]GLR12219.1 iron ABC transporter ATP-binding protein [Chitinimonas prasina]
MHTASQAPETLSAEQLAVTLGGRTILQAVNLMFPAGRITALCGPNGCGKSTLLRTLAGLIRPTSGTARLGDAPITDLAPRERAKRLAMLAQSPLTPSGMTVLELVCCGRFAHTGLADKVGVEDQRWINWAIDATGLAALRDRELAALSGGERQRAWVAMALAQGARVLLLDEPTTFLDVRHQLEVLQLVHRLNREHGMTVVWVLHDLNQAAAFSDHMVLLREGRVYASGHPADVATPAQLETIFGVPMWRGVVDGQSVCLPRMAQTIEVLACGD